jgi:radical SAM superfamily enzyme YgiQ (UPF0313 family)
MRVCLVSSPTASEFDRAVAESDAVRRISEKVPLGILTLAAVLEQRGVAVEVVDLNRLYYRYLRTSAGDRTFYAFAAQDIGALSFDVCGFSTICSTYPLTIRIAREVKRLHPEALVVFGGPQTSAVDAATLGAFPFVDLIVRGEADETFPALLDAVPDRDRIAKIPGVTFRDGERIVRNPAAPVILDLDKLPLPAFHLCPGLGACRVVPLELGRGCPFTCEFCSTSAFFGHRFRLKSPWRVIEQMRAIRQTYGNTRFSLVHDMFTVDRQRVVDFCEALMACGERFNWTCSARTDRVDDELLALMARGGCTDIFFGIETGSAHLQKSIHKNLNLAEAARQIRRAASHGIAPIVSLITGFPDETAVDLRKTVAFLMDTARLDNAKPQLNLLAPLAATPIHEQYRDRLVLSDSLSDTSWQGWQLDPADRELIADHPDVFPNFYAVPACLDRDYLKEFHDFYENSMLRFRWLMVALHRDCGDLLKVFEAWRAWRRKKRKAHPDPDKDGIPYYVRPEFANDLLEFVETSYLRRARNSRALGALLGFELAIRQESPDPPRPQLDDAPRLAPGVRLIRLNADYHQVLACLRSRKPLNEVPGGRVILAARDAGEEKLQVLKLSSLSAQILAMCDGTRSTRQIARRLRPGKELAGIPPDTVCLFSLAKLREQGLIRGSISPPATGNSI